LKPNDSLITIFFSEEEVIIEGYHTDDLIFNKITSRKTFYEDRLLLKVKSLELSGTYVDVGANIGNHSIFFTRFCSSDHVICFEIHESIFRILQRNMDRNCVGESYDLQNIGIYSNKGIVDISEIDNSNAGLTRITNLNGSQCMVDSLDNLISDTNDITLIKIDIEGFELEVIKGATRILSEQSPVIIAELATDEEFSSFLDEVSKFGYKSDGINYAGTPTYFFQKP